MRFAARALGALAILLAALAFAPAGRAQQPAPPDTAAALATAKLMLDEIEAAVGRAGTSGQALLELRARVGAIREDLLAKAAEIAGKRAAAEAQLKDLGPPPTDGRSEAPATAAERARLTALVAGLGGDASLARQLATRAEQLFDRINERRRALFAEKLFERSPSLLDAASWREFASGIADELRGIASLAGSWWGFVVERGVGPGGVALATLLGLALVAAGLGRWWRRQMAARAPGDARFGKAVAGLEVLVASALPLPLALAAVIVTLEAYGLLPETIREIAIGLAIATTVASFGRGVVARRAGALYPRPTAAAFRRHDRPPAR